MRSFLVTVVSFVFIAFCSIRCGEDALNNTSPGSGAACQTDSQCGANSYCDNNQCKFGFR